MTDIPRIYRYESGREPIQMILNRIHSSNKYGTFGVLNVEGQPPFALTLEPPWEDNAPFISCIPEGEYFVATFNSTHFGHCFQIMDVPGRTFILFHKGNMKKDTKGCVMVGEQFEFNGVFASGKGYREFMDILQNEEFFKLTIVANCSRSPVAQKLSYKLEPEKGNDNV